MALFLSKKLTVTLEKVFQYVDTRRFDMLYSHKRKGRMAIRHDLL